MAWHDFFRVWQHAFTDDPINQKDKEQVKIAGTSQPDARIDVRADGAMGGKGSVRLRDSNSFVDQSTVTNRMSRYREYERLRNIPEIETSMTIMADEACVGKNTKVCTPAYFDGYRTIEWLEQNIPHEKFLVYAYDSTVEDFTLAWAHSPRVVKEARLIKIAFDDGSILQCTLDHRILKADGTWVRAEAVENGDFMMAFHRVEPKPFLTPMNNNQFPRIYTHRKGWIHERQMVNEWKEGKDDPQYKELNSACKMIAQGLSTRKMVALTKKDRVQTRQLLKKHGFSNKEMKWLGKRNGPRRVIGISYGDVQKVYDLTVDKYENYCTNWGVVHNCQENDENRVFKVTCKNESVKKELEFILFNRKMLNLDQRSCWNRFKNLCINGDEFWELCIDLEEPKKGILGYMPLQVDSMYRIETTKGKLVEFQQSSEGPDFNSLARVEVTKMTDADIAQATALRMAPDQVIHMKIGDDRKTFYPYGVSVIEAARGPAHSLRLMEDSMIVYRLSRAPERRMFYIDTYNLPAWKAVAFVEKMKDAFKKNKVTRGGSGASAVDDKYHAPAVDEDIWIPITKNSNTRVETLPGASNLGEIDDVVWFRNKLFIALNFPKSYFNNDDPQVSRQTASSINTTFARFIERLQSSFEDGIYQICTRHLFLRGFPEETYDDLQITMTPPSEWRDLTKMEVTSARIQNAGSIKGAALMADEDILVDYLKLSPDEAKKRVAKLKLQKLEDAKLQIIMQNPTIIGIGLPADENQDQVGTQPTENNPMLGGEPPAPDQGAEGQPPPDGMPPSPQPPNPEQGEEPTDLIPEPEEEDIKRFNLDINDFAKDIDREELDYSAE